MSPRRTSKGAATRARLLHAAGAELVSTGGVVEIAAVAKRAEVSPSLLYRYFANKDELLAAVVDDVFERFDDAVMRPDLRELPGTWVHRERERVRRFVAFFYHDPLALVVVRLVVGPVAATRWQARRTWQAEVAAGNLRRGQASGDLPADLDPEVTGAFLMGGLFDALALALSAEPPWEQNRVQRHLERLLVSVVAPARRRTDT